MQSNAKFFVVGTAAALALFAAACSKTVTGSSAGAKPAHADVVAHGAKLVSIGGCNDCHTPVKFDAEIGMPIPDMTRMLSGHPEGAPDPESSLSGHDSAVFGPTFTSFRLPFGVVYTANLTPDQATGLGNWTEEMFVKALRTGRHMGGTGRPILPPMPWPNLAQQSDGDLKAIFAYLRSIPAIKNDVPAPKVSDQAMQAIAGAYDKMEARMKVQAQLQIETGAPSLPLAQR